jgi:hypothetical protein
MNGAETCAEINFRFKESCPVLGITKVEEPYFLTPKFYEQDVERRSSGKESISSHYCPMMNKK